jgi:hypothetical protein
MTFFVAQRVRMRRFDAGFRLLAARLGLEVYGSAPTLSLAGTFRGVEITLVQHAVYLPKKAAVLSYQVRARLPSKEELAWEHDESLTVGTYRGRELETVEVDDLPVVGGWVEYEGRGLLAPNRIESLLVMVTDAARASAKEELEDDGGG